jgi:hypothetical protein
MEHTEYIPGVCNIGPEERRARKRVGWIGLVLTVVLWLALVYFKASGGWYTLIFLSSSLSASGFIQARMRFCAAFGIGHFFNFSPHVGGVEIVTQKELWALDRRKALQIIAYAVFSGLLVTLAAFLSKAMV